MVGVWIILEVAIVGEGGNKSPMTENKTHRRIKWIFGMCMLPTRKDPRKKFGFLPPPHLLIYMYFQLLITFIACITFIMSDDSAVEDADFLYVTTRDVEPFISTGSSAEMFVALIILGVCRLLTTRADAGNQTPPFLIMSSGIAYHNSRHPKLALDRALENGTMAQFVGISQQRMQNVYRLINLMYWHQGHQHFRDEFYRLSCTHQDMVDNTAAYQRVFKLTRDYITPPGGEKLKMTEVGRRVDSQGVATPEATPEPTEFGE